MLVLSLSTDKERYEVRYTESSMDDTNTPKSLEEIFANFKREVEEARGKHRDTVAQILKDIDARHMAEIKKSLGII